MWLASVNNLKEIVLADLFVKKNPLNLYLFQLRGQRFEATVWASVGHLYHNGYTHCTVWVHNGLRQIIEEVRIEAVELNFGGKRVVVDLMLRAALVWVAPVKEHLLKLIPSWGTKDII